MINNDLFLATLLALNLCILGYIWYSFLELEKFVLTRHREVYLIFKELADKLENRK